MSKQLLFFNPTMSGMQAGIVTIVRELDDTERDVEVGRMFRVEYANSGIDADAFLDELFIMPIERYVP